MDLVYCNSGPSTVLYGPTGSVEVQFGEPWFADDPFVVARPDLFSSTPPAVRSTTGRAAPAVTPLAAARPRKSPGRRG